MKTRPKVALSNAVGLAPPGMKSAGMKSAGIGSRRFHLAVVIIAVAAVACGGPTKTSKKDMSRQAADAPPPPGDVGRGKKISRKVTREAKKDFEAAVAAYAELEKAGWTDENCIAAARRFQQVASDHDKVVEAYFNAGLSFHNCGMLKDAEAQYQKAVRIKSGHAASLTGLGEIYYAGGNDQRGEQYWRKAIQANQKTIAARNNLAWVLLGKMREVGDGKARRSSWKKYEEDAKGNLSRALAVDNDNVEAYVIFALIYMEGSRRNKSRLDLANLLLEEGSKRNAEFAPLWNARGLLQLKRDNVGRALSMFEKAVHLEPKFVEARMNVGNIVLGFRKYEYAKQMFEAVLELKPNSYDAVLGRGIAQRGMGDLEGAHATYKKAKKLDPRRGDAFYNLGLFHKDFFASRAADEKSTIKEYKTAKTYFTQYLSKKGLTRRDRKEAKDHVEDCDKAVKQLNHAIRMKKEAERIQRQAEAQERAYEAEEKQNRGKNKP